MRKEIFDLLKAWFCVAIAFTILYAESFFSLDSFYVFVMMVFTVGIGFLLHELAHKAVAKRFGCWAEFRSDDRMLLFMVVISFLGFVFAAPGGVLISGHVTRERNGIISLAGPMMNILLAMVFFVFALAGIFVGLSRYGFSINSWLALFNMLPFFGFDGGKILAWNKVVYFAVLAFSGALVFIGYLF